MAEEPTALCSSGVAIVTGASSGIGRSVCRGSGYVHEHDIEVTICQ